MWYLSKHFDDNLVANIKVSFTTYLHIKVDELVKGTRFIR